MCPWGKNLGWGWFGQSSVVYKMEDGGWVPGLLAGASDGKCILGEEAPLSTLIPPHVPMGALVEHSATFMTSMKSALQGEQWCVTVVRAWGPEPR